MSSAIELYKEAYDLDYNKGDSLYAEVLYKEIIERFPHSDEKEYAQVHLERIAKLKGNPNDPSFKPLRSGGSGGGLAVVCFVLILMILTGLGFAGYYGYPQYLRLASYELIIHGLISQKNNDLADAERMFEQAQRIYPRNSVAFRCLTELYLQTGKPEKAELVRNQWKLLMPNDIALHTFTSRLADSIRQEKKP
ncbi:MAG: tetratricopeptide repeat protein [Chitinispirillaceae bacterium]|nr:tetratricopeptide repeat protein [Chitinispirillaceae bacterium]